MQGRESQAGANRLARLSTTARQAIPANGWPTVDACAREILRRDAGSAEGWFLAGLVAKSRQQAEAAIDAFTRAVELDAARYDVAIELANQYAGARLHGKAVRVIDEPCTATAALPWACTMTVATGELSTVAVSPSNATPCRSGPWLE